VSSWGIARTILRNEGIRGLYYGGVITSIRDSVGYGFYFYSYELSRRLLSSPGDDDGSGAKWKVLLYGGIAGVITWASIFPLDVVKTRVQTQDYPYTAAAVARSSSSSASSLLGEEGRALLGLGRDRDGSTDLRRAVDKPIDRRRGAIAIARQAYREQGLAVFFRGLGLCTVRGFVVSAVQFFVYEWVMELLHQGRRSTTL
jgi:solute carrier family 25 carnitine/acylcarnitine transporter 20/29